MNKHVCSRFGILCCNNGRTNIDRLPTPQGAIKEHMFNKTDRSSRSFRCVYMMDMILDEKTFVQESCLSNQSFTTTGVYLL